MIAAELELKIIRARKTRVLLSFFAAVLFALLLAQRNAPDRSINPFYVRSAHAEGISAAPGFIAISSVTGAAKFYLIDSTKKVICVYQTNGEKIRLVSARKFDADTDIVDSSLDVRTASGKVIKSFEGGSGIDAKTAREYADGLQQLLKDADSK